MAVHSEVELLVNWARLFDVEFINTSVLKVENDVSQIGESIGDSVV